MLTYLTNIWKYRYFWMSLVRMDLRTRYRRSLLGMGWSLLQPLAMTCILAVVFQQILGAKTRDYVPHLLTGLVCWNFILGCALQGCQCFFMGESYIRQCPLPLAIYPLRTAIGGLFHYAMGLVVITCVFAIFRGVPDLIGLVSLLPTMLLLFVFGWSLAVLCGTINVFFQDTQHLAEVGFQIFFYGSPIIWRMEDIQQHPLAGLMAWNPFAAFMTLVRQPLLYGTRPSVSEHYLYAIAVTAVTAALATFLLSRLQKKLIFHL
jgi:ABC-type polysaccharide/polyol phosphate export permease